jgi:hypothetical protein
MAGVEQNFSPLHQMQAFLLVTTNRSCIILCNAFHIWKPSGPQSTPTGCTPLDFTYDDRNCLMLRYLAPTFTKEFQAPRHIRFLQAQLINKKMQTKELNMPTIFGSYSTTTTTTTTTTNNKNNKNLRCARFLQFVEHSQGKDAKMHCIH